MLQIDSQNLGPVGPLLQVEYPHNPEAAAETSKSEVNTSELL